MNKSVSSDAVWHHSTADHAHRDVQNGHRGAIRWFTGLCGAGRYTLPHTFKKKLHKMGCRTYVLDRDNVRHALCVDLRFSSQDCIENIPRSGEVAKLFMESGVIVLTMFISPFRADRERVRGIVVHDDVMEIYCYSTIEACEQRDVKGMYKKARAGYIPEFTCISSLYEAAENPELSVPTGSLPLEDCVQQVLGEWYIAASLFRPLGDKHD